MHLLLDVSRYFPAGCAIIAAIIGSIRQKEFDTASRIYWYYTCAGAIAEVVARMAAIEFGNNMAVYAVYSPIELLLICLYFNFSIPTLRRTGIGWYLAILGIVVSVLNAVFFQPLTEFNSNFLYFEGIVIIGLSLYSFYHLVRSSDDLRLAKLRHFWFPFIQCAFWTITFLNWGLYEYFNAHAQRFVVAINIFIGMISGVTYLCIALVFWQYPKLKPTDE
ncbi:MAG: hypothetical protein ABI169_05615 [Chitinophagaceae bacterium]